MTINWINLDRAFILRSCAVIRRADSSKRRRKTKTAQSLAVAAGYFAASLESLTGALAEYAAFNG